MSLKFLDDVSASAAPRVADAEERAQARRSRVLAGVQRFPGRTVAELAKLMAMSTPVLRETMQAAVAEGIVRVDAKPALGNGGGKPRNEHFVAESAALEAEREAETEAEAARINPALHAHRAPAGTELVGSSALLVDGKVRMQWVKTKVLPEKPTDLLEAFTKSVFAKQLPAAPLVPSPLGFLSDDLLAAIPVGDPHFGLLAHKLECGEDFALEDADRLMYSAVDALVGSAPACRQCLIMPLGDITHADNFESMTRRSGHHLDVSAMWSKVARVALNCIIRCIDRALEKFEIVNVIVEIGNHDDQTAMMLAVCLAHHYRDNPRVRIDDSPATFHWFEFGKNLIGTTHGNALPASRMMGVMANDQAEAWGRTLHRYMYVGHYHNENKHEAPGLLIEYFRTLAAKDRHTFSSGYRSGRSMVCDIIHREFGRITRNEIGVMQLRSAA